MSNLTQDQHETRSNTVFNIVEMLGKMDATYARFRAEILADTPNAAITYKELHGLVSDIFAYLQMYRNTLPDAEKEKLKNEEAPAALHNPTRGRSGM